jgi:hypothetical protein
MSHDLPDYRGEEKAARTLANLLLPGRFAISGA